ARARRRLAELSRAAIDPGADRGGRRVLHIKRPPHDTLRTSLTAATALAAIALIAIGLSDSMRLFSGHEIDPRVPYSPVIFATGVIMLFGSAVVYELVPTAAKHQTSHS